MASSMFSIALLLGAFVGSSTSHFLLNYPPTIGFDDSLETTAPCGSFKVDFATDNVTDFHVGGDALAMTSIHPQATWLFRAAVGEAATPENWTTLLPAVQQTGIGDYCEQDVTVPADYAGQKGVISVVQDAPDGLLYQVRPYLELFKLVYSHSNTVRGCQFCGRQGFQFAQLL